MSGIRFSRRDLFTASTAAAAGALASRAGELMRPARAQTRATTAICYRPRNKEWFIAE